MHDKYSIELDFAMAHEAVLSGVKVEHHEHRSTIGASSVLFSSSRDTCPFARKWNHFTCAALIGLAFASIEASAQGGSAPVFHGYDVISVKANKSGNGNMSWSTADTTLQATNVTVKMLLRNATGIRDQLITGLPGWAESNHFDIQAKIVDPDPALKDRKQTREQSEAEFRAQVLSILQERFHVKTHLETKIQPTYDLIVAKSGSKLTLHNASR